MKSYCKESRIPCFTFIMTESKKCVAKWKHIDRTNFERELRDNENGFAIVTGHTHMVVDLDLKHVPPPELKATLDAGCESIERTPGGYHYWFLSEGGEGLRTKTEMYWDGVRIEGLDVRNKGGICYAAPTSYVTSGGEVKRYEWIKGNLSTAAALPPRILKRLSNDGVGREIEREHPANGIGGEEIMAVIGGLSAVRANSYSQWISVGMALKNGGYECAVWEEWSRQSPKFREGECVKKWRSFEERDKPVTLGTLYHWLKEDNYELFARLQSRKRDVQMNLLAATHATVADAFFEMNRSAYMYIQDDGWYVLQGNQTWMGTGSTDIQSIPDILNRIRDDCKHVLEGLIGEGDRNTDEGQARHKILLNAVKQVSNVSFLKGVACLLRGLYYRNETIKFNDKRYLFAFTNGVVDFAAEPRSFREITPEDYITVTCGYDYRAATWEEKGMVRAFVAKIFPVPQVLEYVLGALGRTFVGENKGQWFHVFTGMGANGKSVLMELCKTVFGGYYQTFSVTYLTKESDGMDRPLPELEAARFARMLVTSEPDERDKFQVSMIKNITGTESVTFRGMFAKKVIPYVPQYMLWVLTNDLPRLSKFDQGIERRMRCVHFPTRFVYAPRAEHEALRDDTLLYRFREEEGWRYGLMGLLLESYSSNPLEMPREVEEFTSAYMLENNPVGAWLRQHYTITGRREDVVQKSELYRAFLADTGVQKTLKAFSEEIKKCNVNDTKNREGTRFFYGIVRKEQSEEN